MVRVVDAVDGEMDDPVGAPVEPLQRSLVGLRVQQDMPLAPGEGALGRPDLSRLVPELAELDPGVKFATHTHFFGYEGRCGAPTLFDAAYTYNLGLTAGSLILDGKTGFMASVRDLESGGRPVAIPLTGLLNVERRHGKDEMVIEKALVKLDSPAFRYFASRREAWAAEDVFCSPGPRQLWGPAAMQLPMTVALNRKYASLAFRF